MNARGKGQSQKSKKQQPQQGRSRSKNRKKAKPKKKELDPVAFWGDHDALPDIESFEISTPNPVAVVNSLGQPPLPGHGAASPHYFQLVYGRATQLASALAMAGGIDDLTPELIEEEAEENLIDDADVGNEVSSEEE